jgi:hypothetical protein
MGIGITACEGGRSSCVEVVSVVVCSTAVDLVLGFLKLALCFNLPWRSIKSFRTKAMPQMMQVKGFSPVSKMVSEATSQRRNTRPLMSFEVF